MFTDFHDVEFNYASVELTTQVRGLKILISLSSVVHETLKPKCSGHKKDEVFEKCTMIFKILAYEFVQIVNRSHCAAVTKKAEAYNMLILKKYIDFFSSIKILIK